MPSIWSTYVQTSEELYLSRSLRFREDNKDLWLNAMKLHNGMNVLEVGCAGGIFCHRIKTFLPRCSVTGLDKDEGHIEYAKQKTADLGIDCRFVQGDATSLPFEENSFDASTSHTVIEHIETTRFLGEQFRVLKPGGIISVLSVRTGLNIAPENWKPTDSEETALFEKAWEKAKEFAKELSIGGYEMKECDFPIALEKAGFVGVDVNVISTVSYAPDNASVSKTLALAQINSERMHAIESVAKALRITPDALTLEEKNRLNDLINQRYDKRIGLYECGQKVWDIATSNILVITGVKPE